MGFKNRKQGLSGIMRVKNEGRFVGACIDTIIDALDELIVVYNDCTDNTEVILRDKVRQYGKRLCKTSYGYRVYLRNDAYFKI
jgi:glycosyltransferase involved in cell wall biosynthesis